MSGNEFGSGMKNVLSKCFPVFSTAGKRRAKVVLSSLDISIFFFQIILENITKDEFTFACLGSGDMSRACHIIQDQW